MFLHSYVCPFGRYCAYGCNKKGQPSNVCWHYFIGECSDKDRIYDRKTKPISGLLKKRKEPSQAEIVEEYIDWKIHGGPVEELSLKLREILRKNKVQAYLDQVPGDTA